MKNPKKSLVLLVMVLTALIFTRQIDTFAKENNPDGKGWVKENGKWYYYLDNGRARDVWIRPEDDSRSKYFDDQENNISNNYTDMDKLGNSWVEATWGTGILYMHADGGFTRSDALHTYNGKYLATVDGKQITGWVKQELWGTDETEAYPSGSELCYFDPDSGRLITDDWLLYQGKWYYFNQYGRLYYDQWANWKGEWYYFGSDGAMLANTTTPSGILLDENGVSQTPSPNGYDAPDGSYFYAGSLMLGSFPASRGNGGDSYAVFRMPDGRYYKGWLRFELKGFDGGEPYVTFWNYFAQDTGAFMYDYKTPDGYQLDKSGFCIKKHP